MAVKSLVPLETERALLGAALADPSLFLTTGIEPDDLSTELHRHVWQAARDLVKRGAWVDSLTVYDELERHNYQVTHTELAGLLAACESPVAGPEYAATVKDKATRRAVKMELEAAGAAIFNRNGDWTNHVAAANAKIAALIAPAAPATARKTSWTAAELLTTDFPEPQWAVPGLVPIGLTFLAGRPKVGKSWLALHIALAVGTGGMVMDRAVDRGRVLYLALEDNPRRLKERACKIGMPTGSAIRFETTWRRFTEGGLDDLTAAIRDDGITLAIVDTLGRALGRADQDDLADMTEIVGGLQEFAVTADMAVIVVDHHRKSSGLASDPVDDIVGSTAKSAVADAVLGLTKEQGKRGATLKVTGRDLEWQDLALQWDALTCCWQYAGTVEEVAVSQGNRGRVLDALGKSGGTMTLTQIAAAAGIGKNNLSPILNEMVDDGLIFRHAKQGREVPYGLHPAEAAKAVQSELSGAVEVSERTEQSELSEP